MSTMISESGSESSTTMSSAPPTNSKTRHHMDDAIRKKKKKKRPVAKVDDLDDTDHQHIKLTKKCKETKRDNGEVAHLPAKKELSIKSESIDSKSHHSRAGDDKRIIEERSDDKEKPSSKSESRDKKSRSKLHNGLERKDKSPKSGSLKTKEKKRYEEIEIDGITINAFRTWEDLQDELNDRISASMRRNATHSATNSSNNQSLDSVVSRAHTSNDSFLSINGNLSPHDSHEPSSSGLMRSSTSSDTQELSKNLNASYQNERILNDRCNTTINESIGQANTSTGVNHSEAHLNELPRQTQHNNQNISHGHREHDNDNQHNQHRHHHRHHHHDSKNSRSHTRDELRADERVRQQQQNHHNAAPLGTPAFERNMLDFKRQQQHQHQNDFFGRPPSPPQPSSRAPPPAPPPASHTAHQYFQQYHQLYQHMQNSTSQHPLSHQQSALPPPPPLPFPQSHHPPLLHQQNPYMQSLIEHHHHQQQQQQQQQHQHLQHHMPLGPPSLPSPYMSPFTITDTIHTISRQTIIPPPMMPPPPALPSLPSLEQLSVTSRYGMGPGPGRMSALEHSHLTSHHQPPSYTPSPTERSFMEFARSYANASNLSSNYSSLMNQSSLTKGPPPGASLYGQLDRISQKSELHHAFGAAGLGAYPGAYPGAGNRPPTSAWQLPGW